MDQGVLAILIIVILGVLSRNNSLALAATLILGLKLTNLKQVLIFLDKNALKWGIIILTMGIIAPFATGRITLKDVNEVLKSPSAIVALLAGAITVILSGRGTDLILENPPVVVGIILGSLIGITFFKGVPIGPLTAAGIVAVIIKYIKH
jgi:uncharacterized membrane protein (DUF441 family)